MDNSPQVRELAIRLFCQHCQALQKTFGWKIKGGPCWVLGEPKEEGAICTSARDAVDAILGVFIAGEE